jgi:hypothetical protein
MQILCQVAEGRGKGSLNKKMVNLLTKTLALLVKTFTNGQKNDQSIR